MIKDDDIIMVKNAFPKTLFKKIQEWVFSNSFNWCYVEGSASSPRTIELYGGEPDNFSFARMLLFNDRRSHPETYLVEAALYTMLDNQNINCTKLHRIRAGLMPKTYEHSKNRPHIDHSIEHYAALVYLNTTNAPTYLYDTLYDVTTKKNTLEFLQNKKLTVIKEIPCIENTAVIFNGLRYHSSSTQTDVSRRVVLNFNFMC